MEDSIVKLRELTESLSDRDAKLAKQVQEWKLAFDAVPDLIILIDPECKIKFLNKTALEYLNLENEEQAIGEHCQIYVHGGEQNVPECCACDVKNPQTEGVVYYDTNLKGWFDYTRSPIHNGDDVVLGFICVLRDITDKKKAEAALKKSEERYRFLVENIPSVAWVSNERGETSYISPNVEKIYGFSQKEIYEGRDTVWFGRIHPDESKQVIEAFKKMFVNGERFDTKYRIQRKDGEWIWIHDSATIAYKKNGDKYAYGVFSDVTERKEAEQRYKGMFDNMDSGVAIYKTEDGKNFMFVDMNKAGERITQTKKEDLLGKTLLEVFPGCDTDEFSLNKTFEEVWKTGEPQWHEASLYQDDRIQSFWPENSVYKLITGELVAIFTDVTERVRAERALKANSEYLESILKAAPIGIGVVINRTFQYVSGNFIKMLGYTEKELVGSSARMVYPSQEEYERVGHIKYDDIERKGIGEVETVWKTKDGKLIDILLRSIPIVPGDITQGVTFTALDITERKLIEKELTLDEERLEALLRFTQLKTDSEKELTDFALEELVKLTGSKIGYLHFVQKSNGIEKGGVDLKLFTWSKATHKNCTAKKVEHYPLESAGVWADCVRNKEPVIHNDYEAYPDKKGMPEGHIPIKRHMSVPVFDDGDIVAVVGVGNKEEPYNEGDVRQATLFMSSMWQLLKRKRYERDLKNQKENYRLLFDTMINGFALHEMIYDDAGNPIDYRFLEVNPAFETITGLKREDIVGKKVTEVIPGVEQKWIDRYGHVAKTGESTKFIHYSDRFKKEFYVEAYSPRPDQFAVNFIYLLRDGDAQMQIPARRVK